MRNFLCTYDECNYISSSKLNLKFHIRNHTYKYLYTCIHDNCEYNTKYKHNLKSHQKKHDREAAYLLFILRYGNLKKN